MKASVFLFFFKKKAALMVNLFVKWPKVSQLQLK